MSASLVGSEMCIRDSDCFVHPRVYVGEGEQGRVTARPGRSRHERRGPVSYTHLTLPTICSV
eukprot:10209092-Alexandrium_andersonii.AAC.1